METYLTDYWSGYCDLDRSHHDWIDTFALTASIKRGSRLFTPGEPGNYLYFVCTGLLATVWWDDHGNRRIDRLLPPRHSVLTQPHLYAHHRVYYEITALRKSTVIRLPADALRAYKESCREADTLVDVMEQKKLKQYRAKNRLMLIKDERKRYIEFARDDYMNTLWLATSQQEQADYLNISRRTITRATRDL